MLCLSFNIDEDIFGISVKNIIEIIPLVKIKKVPHSPESLIGLINYRGDIIPLFDISEIIKSRKSKYLLSTRIIILNNDINDSKLKYVAFLAEQVTETVEYIKENLRDPGISIANADYLGKLLMINNKSIQLINISKLINSEIINFIKKEIESFESI